MSTYTEDEIIALEAYARHGDGKPVEGAAEILRRCRETSPAALIAPRVARSLYEWAKNAGLVRLAIQLLPIHKEHAAAELAARTSLDKAQAERIIAAFVKPKEPAAAVANWSVSAVRKWLMSYARSLSNEAKYIRANADGFAENEDEFRCGLANGLGIDDEDEQTAIIEKINYGTRKEF